MNGLLSKRPIQTQGGTRLVRKLAGFTLLEVTIVLLIMAGVMAIGWPRMRAAGHRADLKDAALTVRGALAEARDLAVRGGRVVQFTCKLDSSDFLIANALTEAEQERLDESPSDASLQTAYALKTGSIHRGVFFCRNAAESSQSSDRSLTILFFPDGRASQSIIKLALADRSHSVKLSVRGLTGGVFMHPIEKILVQDTAVRDVDPTPW